MIRRIQTKVENREILGDARRRYGFRYDDIADIKMPAENDLRNAPAMFGCDLPKCLVFQNLALPKRAPCFRGDAMLLQCSAAGFAIAN